MSSRKPVIHGRDHLPGGADPIPTTGSAAYAPNPLEEWFQVSSVSIASTATTQLTWTSVGGTSSLLDLITDPTQPRVLTRGVYTMDATALGGNPATTVNGFELAGNIVQSEFTGSLHVQWTYSPAVNLPIETALSMTGVCIVGDSFLLQIYNGDSAARSFTCPSIRVTKILEF